MENVFLVCSHFAFGSPWLSIFLHFGQQFFPFSSLQNELGKWISPWGAWWWSQFSWAIWRVVLFLSGIQFQHWPGAWFHEEQLHPEFSVELSTMTESLTSWRQMPVGGWIWQKHRQALVLSTWLSLDPFTGRRGIVDHAISRLPSLLGEKSHSKVEVVASHVKHLNHQNLENYVTMLYTGDITKQYIQIYGVHNVLYMYIIWYCRYNITYVIIQNMSYAMQIWCSYRGWMAIMPR